MGATERVYLPSPQERNQRHRQEVSAAILAAARDIMRRDGVAALTLNEVARLVGMQPPSLYKYFPGKFALYDALFQLAVGLFRESEEQVWATPAPIWERIEAWFERRLQLVQEHPDLYQLLLNNPVPGFVPSPESLEGARGMRTAGRRAITEAMEAGLIVTHLSPDHALDLLLAMRRGIIAEHMGKETHLPAGDERFRALVPEVLALLKEAWTPHARDAQNVERAADAEGRPAP